ncbi:hypothetical protein Syun_003092 [Stephania yunnanensis]|uniref:Uncharacterized protein n=1 Tax=Stephania yunnanensis TaxID=152371 RepID=A0AAP0Q0B1_9MAGN
MSVSATPVQNHDDQSQSHVQTVASSNGDAKEEDTNGFQTNEEEEEEEEEDNKLEEQTEMDSSVVDTGLVDLDSRINGGKEGGQLVSHTVLHDHTEQVVRENGLDVDIAAHDVDSEAMNGFNANGVHLESETMDWDDKDETNVPACQADIVVVTHNLEEAHEDAATSDTIQTQSEYKLVDESVQNSEISAISAPPAVAVKQIIMFGNISAEYGNAFQTPAKFSALEPIVRDLFVERVETTYTDENASESVNSSIEVQDDVEVVGSCKTQPSPLENASKTAHNSIDAQYEGDQSVSVDNGAKEILEEIEGVESNKSGQSPTESTSIHQPEVQKVEQEVASGPFYLIRIPYLGDKFTNEINLAKLQVDEKTQSREAIRLAIRSKKDTCTDCLAKVEAAKSEERAAKDAFNAKRDEMDSIQTEINRMKNATSIDDIDERILNMEHRIEHETMTLKEEKQLLRDMKQLKNQREQLRASLGKKVEVPPTSEERDKIDERLKLLKQQLNAARKEMLQAEGVTREAKKYILMKRINYKN